MKILDELVMACRSMNFAPATEQCYRDWIDDYLRFQKNQAGKWIHPKDLREPAVECYLTYLAVNRQLAASTQTQAMCALVFFYRTVMKEPLGEIAAFRGKRPERVPTVLSVGEVRRVLEELDRHPTLGLLGQLLYGGGLRVSEGCELRVMDMDFDRRQMLVRGGKGWKDRAVPLPGKCIEPLYCHLQRVRDLHATDCAKGPECGWAPLPTSVQHKMPNDGRHWGRQFVFPSAVTRMNEFHRRERWHMATGVVSRAVKEAGLRACRQAGHTPCVSPFLRHASPRKRSGHPHRAATPRPRRCQHHHDLHPRSPARCLRPGQPARPDLRMLPVSINRVSSLNKHRDGKKSWLEAYCSHQVTPQRLMIPVLGK